jgi:hypothetical protein
MILRFDGGACVTDLKGRQVGGGSNRPLAGPKTNARALPLEVRQHAEIIDELRLFGGSLPVRVDDVRRRVTCLDHETSMGWFDSV